MRRPWTIAIRMLVSRGALSLFALGVGLLVPLNASPAAASPNPWTGPVNVDPTHGSTVAIACPTESFCLTLDQHGFVTMSGGSGWGTPTLIDSSQYDTWNALSCSSATSCVAVGVASRPNTTETGLYSSWNGTTWSSPIAVDPDSGGFSSVSCATSTSTFCVATDGAIGGGGHVVIFNGTFWSTPKDLDPSLDGDAFQERVSCPSVSFCEVVNSDGEAFTYNSGSWSTATVLDAPQTPQSISCTSSSFCVEAGGTDVLIFNGSTWSSHSTVDPTGDMVAVSCVPSTLCVAVDAEGQATMYDGMNWATPIAIDVPDSALVAVSCPTEDSCVAMDQTGHAIDYSSGSWASPKTADPPGTITSISCPTDTFCLGVDQGGDAVTFDGTSWSAPSTAFPSGLNSVSCVSSTFCMATEGDNSNGGYAVIWNGSGWSTPSQFDASSKGGGGNVSCVNSTFCVAVNDDSDVYVYNGASWSDTTLADGADFTGVSCTSSSFCIVVGAQYASYYDGMSWSSPVQVIGSSAHLYTVDCVTTTFCNAVDDESDDAGQGVLHFDGANWTQQSFDLSGTPITMSCAGTAFCAATDYEEVTSNDTGRISRAFTFADGAWSGATSVDNSDNLTTLSCPSSTLCVSSDPEGNIYEYQPGLIPTPAVTSVAPSSGPASGGQTVTISGSGLSGATAVDFGPVPGTNLDEVSDTELTVQAPSHAAGQVDVTVTTPGGTSAVTPADHYSFVARPTISAVSPAYGSHAGGRTVSITGTGLTGASKVRFGTTAGTALHVVSGSSLTVQAPSHAAGLVDVSVTTPGGTSLPVAADQYIFVGVPTVSHVSPASGTHRGGKRLTITGTKFVGNVTVSFGSKRGEKVKVISTTTLKVTSPKHAKGAVTIRVTALGGESAAHNSHARYKFT